MITDEYKRAIDKTMSLREAIASFVHDGCSITFGGFGARQPLAAVHEIIRQGIKDLAIITDTSIDGADLLVGAKRATRLEGAYFAMGLLGLGPNIRRAYGAGAPSSLEIEDYSNYAVGLRFLAGAMGVPFLPTRSLLGTDIPKRNKRIIVQQDPYKGEPVALVPAANPDVAIIHLHCADPRGNAQIYGFVASDDNKARAASRVIITCEEIVPTDKIRRDPHLTIIPFYCVDAVVEVPYGAHCSPMAYRYVFDVLFSRDYVQSSQTHEGFLKWLSEWVYGCENHLEYCQKVGWERLRRLTHLERMASGGAP